MLCDCHEVPNLAGPAFHLPLGSGEGLGPASPFGEFRADPSAPARGSLNTYMFLRAAAVCSSGRCMPVSRFRDFIFSVFLG